MKIEQATAAIVAVKDQVVKAKEEVIAKIQALEEAAGDETTPEFDAALEDLKTAVQAIDDINPDQPT